MSTDDLAPIPEGWERRRLCPDGACIGIIGNDGLCTECRQPPPGEELDPRIRGLRTEDEVEEEVQEHRVATSTPEAPDDWDARQLCPDGACVGVLAADGRCPECGAVATPEKAD